MLFPFHQSGNFLSSLIDECLKYKNKEKRKTGPRPGPCLNYDVKIVPKPSPGGVKKSGARAQMQGSSGKYAMLLLLATLATVNTFITCCCEHVINAAAVHITSKITLIYNIHESPHSRSIQVELGKVEGFWTTLQLLQQALAHWLLIQRTNQLHHVIMMSLCQTELDLSDCAI